MRVLYVLRQRIRMIQMELATRANISQGEVSLIEHGYRTRGMDRVLAELKRHPSIADDVPDDPRDLMREWDEYRDSRRGLLQKASA
jgi:transcriptional regulator with XRE-family HTH domain